MTEYGVYYKDKLIGKLSVSEDEYRYEADKIAIGEIEKNEKVVLLYDVSQSKTAKAIPFFKVRIENCKRFSEDVVYPNSEYSLKKV